MDPNSPAHDSFTDQAKNSFARNFPRYASSFFRTLYYWLYLLSRFVSRTIRDALNRP